MSGGFESIGMGPKALCAPISGLKWSVISLLTECDGITICNGEMTGKAGQPCRIIWLWWEAKCTQERPVPGLWAADAEWRITSPLESSLGLPRTSA